MSSCFRSSPEVCYSDRTNRFQGYPSRQVQGWPPPGNLRSSCRGVYCCRHALSASNPDHAGKDVYYWMFQTSSSDLKENPGLSALGTNAVPSLATALRVRRTEFDRYTWLQSFFVQKAITNFAPFGWTHPASTVQRAAARSLLAYGYDAKLALDALHEALVDPDLDTEARRDVINALGELGPPPASLPHFVEAWHQATNDSSLRRDLVLKMSYIATFSPELSLPIFLAELNSGNQELRNVAIWGAGALGPVAHGGVAAAESMIHSTNAYSQFAAAVALGRITNRMPALLPRLRELASGTNGQAAASAALTLFRWGEPGEKSVAVLTDLLTNK